jgi:hypothetical protein
VPASRALRRSRRPQQSSRGCSTGPFSLRSVTTPAHVRSAIGVCVVPAFGAVRHIYYLNCPLVSETANAPPK